MNRRGYGEIDNPVAYENAKRARIRANGNVTRRRKLLEAIEIDSADFKRWLLNIGEPPAPATSYDQADDAAWAAWEAERKSFGQRYGALPAFLREQLHEWDGLSEKQLATARRVFVERGERGRLRNALDDERRANATPWTAGRQTVRGTILSSRRESFGEGYRASVTLKALVQTADGAKLWSSIPWAFAEESDGSYAGDAALKGRAIAFTVTVEPSADDPTMAFGKRPRLLKEG